MNNIELFKDYENAKLSTAEEFAQQHRSQTVPYSALPETEIDGIPICIRRDADGFPDCLPRLPPEAGSSRFPL